MGLSHEPKLSCKSLPSPQGSFIQPSLKGWDIEIHPKASLKETFIRPLEQAVGCWRSRPPLRDAELPLQGRGLCSLETQPFRLGCMDESFGFANQRPLTSA